MGNCFCLNNKLDGCTFDNTPTYSLNGKRLACKILKIYDGDTLWLAIKIHGKYYKYKCRMYGYDSPEMKPPLKQKDRDDEIKRAHEAKDYLAKLMYEKHIEAEFFGYCKYGRPLVNLYAAKIRIKLCGMNLRLDNNFILINKEMIESKHGYEYFGGTKEKVSEEIINE